MSRFDVEARVVAGAEAGSRADDEGWDDCRSQLEAKSRMRGGS